MRKGLIILFTLITIGAFAQTNPNPTVFAYGTLNEAISRRGKVGSFVKVKENGIISDFVIDTLIGIADNVFTFDQGGRHCLRKAKSQSIALNFESDFGGVGDGVTDNYDAFQKLAAFLNSRGGHANISLTSTIYPNPNYYINRIKIAPTVVDTIYIRDTVVTGTDSLGNGGGGIDTIITTQILDTVTNTNTNILYTKLSDVHFFGGGATISVKGDFKRKATKKSGPYFISNYTTVCPFVFSDCHNITLENLHLNGNADKMTRDAGVIEGDCYGIKLLSCTDVHILDVSTNHFATDGLITDASNTLVNGKRVNTSNVLIENFTSWYNARQAYTVGSTDHVTCTNCNLSHTGDSLVSYGGGHAPQRGVDLEPIFGLDKVNTYTSNITFNNCQFLDNTGGAVSAALSIIKDVYMNNCVIDNRKANAPFVFIMGINNFNLTKSTIYTGRGDIRPVWGTGKGQKSALNGNTIYSNSDGILVSGVAPEYGCDIDNNVLIGQHDSTVHNYFPFINARINFRNNIIFFDSLAYGDKNRALIQFCNNVTGNTWLTDMKTAGGKLFTVSYASSSNVSGERWAADSFAVRPFTAQNWNIADNPSFGTNTVNVGSKMVMDNGTGTAATFTYGTGAPTSGKYNAGSIIWMRNPVSAGFSYYQCTVSGTAGADAQFQGVGAIGATGTSVTYKTGLVKDASSNLYVGQTYKLQNDVNRLISTVSYPDSAVYTTPNLDETGAILFKIPGGFTSAAFITADGAIAMSGKGAARFSINTRLLGSNTFFSPTLDMEGDSSLLSTKVRLLKDASNNAYIAFFDTTSTLTNRTTVQFKSFTMSGTGASAITNAAGTWSAQLVTSFSGYTLMNTLINTSGHPFVSYDNGNQTMTVNAKNGDAIVTSRVIGANTSQIRIGGSDGVTIGSYQNGVLTNMNINANSVFFNSGFILGPNKNFQLYNSAGTQQGFYQMTTSTGSWNFQVNVSTQALKLTDSGRVIVGGPINPKSYTVATLPSASTNDICFVTDALNPVSGQTVVGGGSTIIPVYRNGTNWIAMGAGSGSSTNYGNNTITVTTATATIANIPGNKTVVLVNYSGGTATVTLPAAASNTDKDITIKSITTNSVTISGAWINDANTIGSNTYNAYSYHSDGTNWYMTARN
jgi:hypothetical protein